MVLSPWSLGRWDFHGIRRRWSSSTRRGRYLLVQFRRATDLIPTMYPKTEQKSTGQQSTSFHYKPRAETSKVGLTNKQTTRLLLREAIQTTYFWWFISMERPNFLRQSFSVLILLTELQFRCCTGRLFNSSQSCDLNAMWILPRLKDSVASIS